MSQILIDGNPLEIECDSGKVSDGYHTFDELYEHRCLLFCMLLTFIATDAPMVFDLECWKSKQHSDGSSFDGWFVAGINGLLLDPVTYHLPDRMWDFIPEVPAVEQAPAFDGHTSQDVIKRITDWLMIGQEVQS